MLFTVQVTCTAGHYHAETPDLPECTASGTQLSQVLARVHLEIEARVGQLLAQKQDLPTLRSLNEIQQSGDYASGGLYEIYVDDHQLAAMTVHQAGK